MIVSNIPRIFISKVSKILVFKISEILVSKSSEIFEFKSETNHTAHFLPLKFVNKTKKVLYGISSDFSNDNNLKRKIYFVKKLFWRKCFVLVNRCQKSKYKVSLFKVS